MTHWCRDIERDEAVRASEDGRPGPMPTLEEAIAGVTNRRPVEPGGGGNVTGVRTERVTLEVTHGESFGVSHWSWVTILRLQSGESVRVVEDGDSWRAACESARIASGTIADITAERDAAIRERNEFKARVDYLERDRKHWCVTSGFHESQANALRARVAELESQLESVACRAATAENRVAELEAAAKAAPAANADARSNHAAPAASVVPDVVRDMTDIIRGNATDDEKHAAVATLVEAVCPGWRLAPAASNSSAILTSSPAASGAAGTEANG